MQQHQTTQEESNQSQPICEYIDPVTKLYEHEFEQTMKEFDEWIDERLNSITLND